MTKCKKLPLIVADKIRADLAALRPGDLLPTEMVLERRFAVSNVTLREALRSLVQQGLLTRRQGSGTYVADRSRTQPVGVLLDLDISNPRSSRFHIRVAQALCEWLDERRVAVRLYAGRTQPGETPVEITAPGLTADVEAGRLCGLAVVYGPWTQEWADWRKSQGIPSVGLWVGDYDGKVNLDYAGMLKAGTSYLLDHGRRRLACIGWSKGNLCGEREKAGAAAWSQLLRDSGVAVQSRWVRFDMRCDLPGAGWSQFRELWVSSDKKPDGLIVLDDSLIDDVKLAIMELGIRVPEQLLIVSHANKNIPLLTPFPLVRMEFDPDECAARLGEMLLKAIRRQPVNPALHVLDFKWNANSPSVFADPIFSSDEDNPPSGFDSLCVEADGRGCVFNAGGEEDR